MQISCTNGVDKRTHRMAADLSSLNFLLLAFILGLVLGTVVTSMITVSPSSDKQRKVSRSCPPQQSQQPHHEEPAVAESTVADTASEQHPRLLVNDQIGSTAVVVGHAREWLGWVEAHGDSADQWFIYDAKIPGMGRSGLSDEAVHRYRIQRIPLDDWGGEAHAYLRHIVDYYDRLPDMTFFLHGWPFDHQEYVIPVMRCLRPDVRWASLNDGRLYHLKSIEFGEEGIPEGWDTEDGGSGGSAGRRTPWNRLFDGMADRGWTELPRYVRGFLKTNKYVIRYYCCAQFAASRRAIHTWPHQFWKDLLDVIAGHDGLRFFAAGHMEIMWHILFDWDERHWRRGGVDALTMSHQYWDDKRVCELTRPGCWRCSWDRLMGHWPQFFPPLTDDQNSRYDDYYRWRHQYYGRLQGRRLDECANMTGLQGDKYRATVMFPDDPDGSRANQFADDCWRPLTGWWRWFVAPPNMTDEDRRVWETHPMPHERTDLASFKDVNDYPSYDWMWKDYQRWLHQEHSAVWWRRSSGSHFNQNSDKN